MFKQEKVKLHKEKKDLLPTQNLAISNDIFIDGLNLTPKRKTNKFQIYVSTLKLCCSKTSMKIEKIITKIKKVNCPLHQILQYQIRKIKTDRETACGKKMILALDLDETLIRSETKNVPQYDHEIVTKKGKIYVKKRPYLEEFLESMYMYFDIVIYTASQQDYADPIVDYIDPKGRISQRYYREHCQNFSGIHYKNLRNICPDLEKILIIDNSNTGIVLNPKNGYQISSWFNDDNDEELQRLTKKIQKVVFTPLTRIHDIIHSLK